MRNRQITLMDLGLDAGFDASMTFVQGILASVNAGLDDPVLDINFIRTRDVDTITAGMTSPSNVLHVMAHGDHSESPSFTSSDEKTTVSLSSLAERIQKEGSGIVAGCVIADGCKTGIGLWQRAIRDCLEQPITYIGTSKMIGWHEATVFFGAFYGALTRNKGAGSSAAEQAFDAGSRSVGAYELLTDRACPFKVVTLTPSKKALSALGR